ncbi:MAG: lipoate--protein ligase, partial [Bacillota bacterium]
GAVYHDLGNLNFSFIERTGEDGINLRLFTERVAGALRRMGLEVEVSGRNDLTIDGRKFSGNAQYRYRDLVLHHGTILYDSNLDCVQAALNVKPEKIASKGVKSVRGRVTNLIDYMPRPLPILHFRDALLKEFLRNGVAHGHSVHTLNRRDLVAVERLVKEKYSTWDWNFGRSPDYNLKRTGRFSCGGIEVYLKVHDGVIQSCSVYGDFFTDRDISELESGLSGTGLTEDSLRHAYNTLQVQEYFRGLETGEFLRLFLGDT